MPWRTQAACIGRDTDVFFPDDPDDGGQAKAICAGCPVQEPCLEYALHHENEGVFGGTTPRERYEMREGRHIYSCECALCKGKRGPEPVDKRRQELRLPQTWCRRNTVTYRGGCRCVHCTAAWTAASRSRSRVDGENRINGVPQPWCRENTSSYRRGCRCAGCRAAKALEKDRGVRARQRARYGSVKETQARRCSA